jgi:hypothetical protein
MSPAISCAIALKLTPTTLSFVDTVMIQTRLLYTLWQFHKLVQAVDTLAVAYDAAGAWQQPCQHQHVQCVGRCTDFACAPSLCAHEPRHV